MDFDFVVSAINRLTTSKPPVLLFCGLLALGYAIKLLGIAPSNWIPRINLAVAMVIYPLLAQAHPEDVMSFKYPIIGEIIRDELIALVVFGISWAAHFYIGRKIEAKFAKTEPLTGAVDSGTKPP